MQGRDFLLVAPVSASLFECSEGPGLVPAPADLGTFAVNSNGSLVGSGLPDHQAGEGATRTEFWSPGRYCMVFGVPPDYSYDYDEPQQVARIFNKTENYLFFGCRRRIWLRILK